MPGTPLDSSEPANFIDYRPHGLHPGRHRVLQPIASRFTSVPLRRLTRGERDNPGENDMMSGSQATLRSAWLLGLWTCALGASSWSGRVEANCPDADPCETLYVYRLQSKMPVAIPPILSDAAQRPLVSLQEANASDEVAFRGPLNATASTKLAIRFQVTRIAIQPNNYCNCNLEHADKGCHEGTSLQTLRQCIRICRYNDGDCKVAGLDPKADGGRWYAFPAATRCGGIRTNWQKQVFRFNAADCDWREDARVIKGAGCLANALRQAPQASLDVLFGPHSPCPDEHL
jgi:hypothetical protein